MRVIEPEIDEQVVSSRWTTAIAITKPLSGLDFERFRHCTNHNSM